MRFMSTRDKTISLTSAEAIAQGISVESGLFVPSFFPNVSAQTLENMMNMDYQNRAFEVLKLLLTDFSEQELRTALSEAYGVQFDNPKIAPLHTLSKTEHLLELWHGPTCAFKDMALQLLPHLLTLSFTKVLPNKKAIVLVATSGDTGKAALEGFANVENTEILVFYPAGGVSKVQELQMATQIGDNVHVFAVEGNFDNIQTMVKEIFVNQTLKEALAHKNLVLSSANSINWGRLAPQIAYYFSAYVDLVADGIVSLGEAVNVCVPTGNFGNILAAHYAKCMGLPLGKLICASNENKVLTDFFATGTYDIKREFKLTNSPSMDILISSNLERLLFELESRSDEKVREHAKNLATHGEYTVSASAKEKMDNKFYSGFCSEQETLSTITTVFQESGYLADPHTAVALKVYREYREKTKDETPTIVVSTASPYKFADAILPAVVANALPTDAFDTLSILERASKMTIPPQIIALKNKRVRFEEVIPVDEMQTVVRRTLNLD